MPKMSAKEIAKAIAGSPETQAQLLDIANDIAATATSAANGLVGEQHKDSAQFGVDSSIEGGKARAHIWAVNGAAIHAERKAAVLVDAASKYGTGHTGKTSSGVMKARRGLK